MCKNTVRNKQHTKKRTKIHGAPDSLDHSPRTFGSAFSYLIGCLNFRQITCLLVAIGAMLAAGYLANQPAIFVGQIMDKVLSGSVASFGNIFPFLLLIGLSLLFKEILTVLRKYIVEKMATSLEKEEFTRLVSHLLAINIQVLGQNRIGALTIRIHRSIEGIIKLLKVAFLDFVPTSITAIVALIFVIERHWSLSFIMLSVIGIGTLLTYLQVSSQRGIRLHLFKVKEEIGGHLTELLSSIEYIRAAGMRKTESTRAEALAEKLRQQEFRHHKWMMSFDAGKQLTESLGFICVITAGTLLALQGKISPGDVLTLTVLYKAVTTPLQDLHRIIDEGHEAVLKVGDLIAMHALPSDLGLDGQQHLNARQGIPLIKAENLSVSYEVGNGQTHSALKQVCLTISRGERIGIAGLSGSGKSTFIKTLLGLVPSYEGSLLIDGQEMQSCDKEELASLVSYASQRPFLLAGTVQENISYGNKLSLKEEDIWAMLANVRLEERTRNMPDILQSTIREQGRNLSGGEQQRLMLARTLLKEAELFIFDEASSALDAETDKYVQNAISEKTIGKTVLTIAHRLSTLRWTNRILVFKEGCLVQDGSYDELINTEGEFKNLLMYQNEK